MRQLAALIFILGLVTTQAWAQRPLISYLDKTEGAVNEIVTISGAGFDSDPANLQVAFGGAVAEIVYASEFLIEAKVPASATWGYVQVTNLTSGLSGISNGPFTLSFGGDEYDPNLLLNLSKFDAPSGGYDLCTCDFNKDGKMDVATSHQAANSIGISLNSSEISSLSFEARTIATGFNTNNITCADLNMDGKYDLLASKTAEPGEAPVLIVFINNTPAGSFEVSWNAPITIPVTGQSPRRIEVVDLNQDGLPDIVFTNDSNNLLTVLRNTSTGGVFSFATNRLELVAPGSPKAGLTIGDFNQDGFPDIGVSTSLDSDVYLFINESTPEGIAFRSALTIPLAGSLSNVLFLDVDKDGFLDVVANEALNGRLLVLRNLGTDQDRPTFSSPIITSVSGFPWGISAGDINGDGLTDLALGTLDVNRRYTVLINESVPGTISFSVDINSATEISRNVKIADMNGDAKPDVILTNVNSGDISIALNQNCLIPKLSPSETITICEGLDFTLTATENPGTTYRWTLDGNIIQDSTLASVQIEEAGQYQVTALSFGGVCANASDGVAQLVTTGTIPAPPAINEPDPVCIGDDLTLQATFFSNSQYVWRGPQGFRDTLSQASITIPDFSAEKAGRYFVEVLVDGCQSGEVSAVAQVVNLPFIEIFNRNQSPNLCDGDSTLLEVVNYPGYTYQWFRDDAPIDGETTTSLSVSTAATYSADIIDPLSCTFSTEPSPISTFSPPEASFSIPAATCAGEEVLFQSTSVIAENTPVEYTWNFGNARGDTGDSLVYVYPGSGDFVVSLYVSYSEVPNCDDDRTRPLRVTPSPVVTVTNSRDTLGICPDSTLVLTASSNFESYRWSNGENTQNIVASDSGVYTVISTNNLGCTDTLATRVNLLPLPDIQITGDPATGVVRGDTATLQASGGFVYIWSPADFLNTDMGDSVRAFPTTTTEYWVYSLNEYGCPDSSNYFLDVLPTREDGLPAAFSPNGDGIDDTWFLINSQAFEDCKLTILNRNGSTVYTVPNGYDNTWGGTYQGSPLPEGVYYYVFECPDSPPYSGAITLIR